jgi:hypothetical protein
MPPFFELDGGPTWTENARLIALHATIALDCDLPVTH